MNPVLCVRSLNVDMEWLYGASESSNMEVDIGYLPQVRLQGSADHRPQDRRCEIMKTI